MAYSAQFSAPVPYSIPAQFYEGKINAIEIPVIGGVGSLLSNFTVNLNNRLEFTGTERAHVAVKAKLSFGSQQPSQTEPNKPIDYGPKATTYGWIQVGDQKSVLTRFDQTLYYLAFEYPIIVTSLDVDYVFDLKPNDELKFFVYYEWVYPPQPPVDVSTFYLTIQQANLSWVINSSDKCHEHGNKPAHVLKEDAKVTIPINSTGNFPVLQFVSSVQGKRIIQIRMNILDASLYNNDTTLTTAILNSDWYAYIAVNGVLTPTNLVYQTITNQFNLYNPIDGVKNTVWPATLELYLLADLHVGDMMSVIVNITAVLAPLSTPPYLLIVPDGHGSIIADLDFNILISPPLYADALVLANCENKLCLPVDGCINNALNLPLDNVCIKIFTHCNDFVMKNGKLIYQGSKEKRYQIRAALNISDFLLETKDNDPVVTSLQNLGFALGVNNHQNGNIETFDNVYADTRYKFKWLASKSTFNTLKLKPGDEISLLLYANNVKYLNVPPVIGTVIPNKTPVPGSVIKFSASASLVIE